MRFAVLRGRRGVNNVVATMLIFALMIASIGVLYNQITPTLLGYEARATTANQAYIFESISQDTINLVSTNAGSESRFHIVSEQTIYDIDNSVTLTFDILDAGVSLVGGPQITEIGKFTAEVNGSYQPTGVSILNRAIDQSTFMNNGSNGPEFVLTSDYSYNTGDFEMYFRSRINLHQIITGDWKMTITIIQIDYLASPLDNSPLAFPIEIPEWTLRMRRQASTVTNFVSSPITGPLTLEHSLDSTSGTDFIFPDLTGQNLEIEIITVPILFGI